MTQRLLITGSTGFVGRQLVEYLKTNAHFLLRLTGRTDNLPALQEELDYVKVAELSKNSDWKAAVENCEVVIHLAARVHIMRETALDPLEAFRAVNVEGTLNLARQAAAAGVKRFIFLSSIKVNGEQTETIPFSAADTVKPLDPYGRSKYEAEQGLLAIAHQTGMEVVIIRPPLIYGPGVKGNFQLLLRSLAKGLPLPLAAINNKRSLVAIDNLIDLIQTCISHPKAANQVFLVSDGEDLSTSQLLRKIGQALGKPARLLAIPPKILYFLATIIGKKDMIDRLCGSLQVDLTKTYALLEWRPPVPIDLALAKTVKEYQANEQSSCP